MFFWYMCLIIDDVLSGWTVHFVGARKINVKGLNCRWVYRRQLKNVHTIYVYIIDCDSNKFDMVTKRKSY